MRVVLSVRLKTQRGGGRKVVRQREPNESRGQRMVTDVCSLLMSASDWTTCMFGVDAHPPVRHKRRERTDL